MNEWFRQLIDVPVLFIIGSVFVIVSGVSIGLYSRLLEQQYSLCPDCSLTTFETQAFQLMSLFGFIGFSLMIGSIGREIWKKYRKSDIHPPSTS